MGRIRRHLWLSPKTRAYIISFSVLFALLYGVLPYAVLRQPGVVERLVGMLNILPFISLDLASTQQWAYAGVGRVFDVVLVVVAIIFVLCLVSFIKDVVKGKPQESHKKKSAGEVNSDIKGWFKRHRE